MTSRELFFKVLEALVANHGIPWPSVFSDADGVYCEWPPTKAMWFVELSYTEYDGIIYGRAVQWDDAVPVNQNHVSVLHDGAEYDLAPWLKEYLS